MSSVYFGACEELIESIKQAGLTIREVITATGLTDYQATHILHCRSTAEERARLVEGIERAKRKRLIEGGPQTVHLPPPVDMRAERNKPYEVRRGPLYKASEYIIAKSNDPRIKIVEE